MRLARLVLVSVLLLAACGGDDDTASDPAADPAADQAAVDAAMEAFTARLEDDGFSLAPDDGDEDDFEFVSEECKAIEDQLPEESEDLPGETASAESGSYEQGEIGVEASFTVEGGAGAVEDAAALDPIFELLADDLFGRCMEEAFQAGMAEDTEAGGPQVELTDFETAPLDSGVGDQSAGVVLTGTIGAGGFSLEFDMAIEFASVGRRAAFLLTSTIGSTEKALDHAGYLALLLAD